MHFRHFILMFFLFGAAVFLPNNVFAEKNELAGQPEPQNSAVQTDVSENIENTKASEKTMPVTPKPVNKSQGGVVQNPVTNTPFHQTVPLKPDPKLLNKTARDNDKAQSSLAKNVKAGIAAEPTAKEKHIEPTGPAKPNAVTNKPPEVPALHSLHDAVSEAKTKRQSPSFNARLGSQTSISIKTDSAQTLEQKKPIDREDNTPSNNKKVPVAIQIINNPPQRTQSSGGQSNDQLSPGTGTISFIANWFEWDDHFELNLGQLYTSRQAKYCNQWMNAPPHHRQK